MPNRIIKDSICESEGLSECSFFARDLYNRLITYADDYGRFNADTQIMYARLYPRELDSVTQEDIIDALLELVGVGKISFYTSKARHGVYGVFPRWGEHQRIRESKAKCPDPDDTDVNDWYLQRFIPMYLKVKVIERDGFKCQICGKFVTSGKDAKRLAKHGCGMYHIDHLVPVFQGGRATLENLRLTCPQCNMARKKRFSFNEIVAFSTKNDTEQKFAASCGELPPESNPIQSESNPNPTTNPKRASAYFLKKVNPDASPRSLEELSAFVNSMGDEICIAAMEIAMDEKKPVWSYVRGILRRWQREGVKCIADVKALDERHEQGKSAGKRSQGATKPQPGKPGEADQRARDDMDRLRKMMEEGKL